MMGTLILDTDSEEKLLRSEKNCSVNKEKKYLVFFLEREKLVETDETGRDFRIFF